MKPPEDVRREFVQQWLAKSHQDRTAARIMADTVPTAAAFHAQQAAEKALKALLVWHQVEFPKTHDLNKLLKLLATVGVPIGAHRDDLANLSR